MEKDSNNKNVTISLPNKLIPEMDQRAKDLYKKRSEYIKDLIIADLREDDLPL